MSGINGAKYKLMPESPEVDLKIIEEKAKKIVENFGGKNKDYCFWIKGNNSIFLISR